MTCTSNDSQSFPDAEVIEVGVPGDMRRYVAGSNQTYAVRDVIAGAGFNPNDVKKVRITFETDNLDTLVVQGLITAITVEYPGWVGVWTCG